MQLPLTVLRATCRYHRGIAALRPAPIRGAAPDTGVIVRFPRWRDRRWAATTPEHTGQRPTVSVHPPQRLDA